MIVVMSVGATEQQAIDVRNLIKALSPRHTILISTHLLAEVEMPCQRVLIINKGQIVATDTPANLTRQLQKSAQIQLRIGGQARELAQDLENLGGVQKVSLVDADHQKLFVETDQSRDLRS